MTTRIKLRELETHLQKVEGFNEPKILLEQYPTRPHIAACMLHTIQSVYGDIEDRMVCDLGSGCGMLTIGSVMLGAGYVLSIECDQDAIDKCQENLDMFDLDNVDIVQDDVTNMKTSTKFDTVVMNPPFGCRTKGIDTMFVQQGLKMANVVYSLHKTSTRKHILKKFNNQEIEAKVIAELRYDLPASYKHHKKKTLDIEVDFVRFSNKNR